MKADDRQRLNREIAVKAYPFALQGGYDPPDLWVDQGFFERAIQHCCAEGAAIKIEGGSRGFWCRIWSIDRDSEMLHDENLRDVEVRAIAAYLRNKCRI